MAARGQVTVLGRGADTSQGAWSRPRNPGGNPSEAQSHPSRVGGVSPASHPPGPCARSPAPARRWRPTLGRRQPRSRQTRHAGFACDRPAGPGARSRAGYGGRQATLLRPRARGLLKRASTAPTGGASARVALRGIRLLHCAWIRGVRSRGVGRREGGSGPTGMRESWVWGRGCGDQG